MNKKEHEAGQSILIIALVVMVLLALIALVVDVGNAYAHRRMVQNAVDAAAMAGARMLAFRGSTEPLETVRHREIASAVYDYAEKNGLRRQDVRAWLILNDGTPTTLHQGSRAEVDSDVVGVGVEGDLPFDTYFAHLLGFSTMQATADSAAFQIWGPCTGVCLFPVIISEDTFPNGAPELGQPYVLWEQTLLTPGNFGWLYWVDGEGNLRGDPPQGPEVTVLEDNLVANLPPQNCRSGGWQVGDSIHGDNGVNFQPVLDLLEQYLSSGSPVTVTIPIYSVAQYEGNNSLFEISGFGRFVLLCAHSSRAHYTEACEDPWLLEELGLPHPAVDNNKYLVGKFVSDQLPEGFEDGCIDTGVTGISLRPPKSLPKSGWMPKWTEDE